MIGPVGCERFTIARVEVRNRSYDAPRYPHALGHRDEIDHTEVGLVDAPLEAVGLQAAQHAVSAIVEHADDHRHAILRGGGEFGGMEHEAAIAVDQQRPAAAADRRANCHRQTGTDRAGCRAHRGSRRQNRQQLIAEVVSRHRGVAHHIAVVGKSGAHQIHDRRVIGADAASERRAHAVAHLEHRRVELRVVGRRIVQTVVQRRDRKTGVADHRHRRRMRATDRAGIYVDVNQLSRRLQPMIGAVHAGLEPRADRERYVGLFQCARHRAALIQVAHCERMPLLHRATTVHGGDDRRAEPLCQFDERGPCFRRDHAATGDDHASPRLLQQLDGSHQRRRVRNASLAARHRKRLVADVRILQIDRNLDRTRLAATVRHLRNHVRQQRRYVACLAGTLDGRDDAPQHRHLLVGFVNVTETATVEAGFGLTGDHQHAARCIRGFV